MKTSKKIKSAIGLLTATLLLGACTDDNYYNETENREMIPAYREHIKNQLYYIPHEKGKTDFPRKYEAFLTDFPQLEIIGVANDPKEDTYNTLSGYFIFTKLKVEKDN